jgi:hypothetical protein
MGSRKDANKVHLMACAAPSATSVVTEGSGSVKITGAPYHIQVDTSGSGSVTSTPISGASKVPSSTGLGATDGNNAGCKVRTAGSGAVHVDGPTKDLNTHNTGRVEMDFASPQAMPATVACAGGDNTRGPGDHSITAAATVARAAGDSNTVAGAGARGNGKEGVRVSRGWHCGCFR